MTNTDPETIAVYDTKADDYANAFTDIYMEPGLAGFIDRLPKSARILDLGCGPGAHAAVMHHQSSRSALDCVNCRITLREMTCD